MISPLIVLPDRTISGKGAAPMHIVVDLMILGLVLGMTYALMSEGLWGAALMFFNCLFAGLIAFNFYEPLANLIVESIGVDSFIAPYVDMVMLMVLFILPLFLLRLGTEILAPSMVRFPTPVYHLGRVVFALSGAMVAMGMIMLAFATAPVQKTMFGVIDYKYEPFFKERFDRDFLGFFQYTSGYTFARNGAGSDPDIEFPAKPMLFDPQAMWLLNHQQSRPYGTGEILDEAPGEGGAAAAPAAGGAAPAGKGSPTPN